MTESRNICSSVVILLAGILVIIFFPGCIGSNKEAAIANIVIDDIKIRDVVIPGTGKPGQVVMCRVINNNNFSVYGVRANITVTLDGSGTVESEGDKIIDRYLMLEEIPPRDWRRQYEWQGTYIFPEVDGRCLKASIEVTDVELKPETD